MKIITQLSSTIAVTCGNIGSNNGFSNGALGSVSPTLFLGFPIISIIDQPAVGSQIQLNGFGSDPGQNFLREIIVGAVRSDPRDLNFKSYVFGSGQSTWVWTVGGTGTTPVWGLPASGIVTVRIEH